MLVARQAYTDMTALSCNTDTRCLQRTWCEAALPAIMVHLAWLASTKGAHNEQHQIHVRHSQAEEEHQGLWAAQVQGRGLAGL